MIVTNGGDPALAGTPGTRAHRRWPLLPESVVLGIGLAILLRTARPTTGGDGGPRFADLVALWSGQVPGSKYSSIQAIFASPVYAAAKVLDRDPSAAVAYFNIGLVLTLGTLCAILLARRTNARVALWAALVMLAASMLPNHLQAFYGEVLTAFLLVLAVLMPPRFPGSRAAVGALAVVATPVFAVPLAIAGVVALFTRRGWWLLAASITGVIGVLLEAWIRFGSLAESPYFSDSERGFATVLPYSGNPGFSYPVLFGIISVVLSFGKGLVYFIPGLFAFGFRGVRQWFDRDVAGMWPTAAFTASLIAAYGAWWAWYGGSFWGPRFFLVLCFPAAVALAMAIATSMTWKARLVVSALLLASTWVGINGYVFGQQGLDICWTDNYRLEFLCWYVPEFSVLWHPFVTGSVWAAHADPRAPFALWAIITVALLTYRTWRPVTSTIRPAGGSERRDDSSPTPQHGSRPEQASPRPTPPSATQATGSGA